MVGLLQSLHLFLDLLLHVSALQRVDERRSEVESAHRPGISHFLLLEIILSCYLLHHFYLLFPDLFLGVREQHVYQCCSFLDFRFNLLNGSHHLVSQLFCRGACLGNPCDEVLNLFHGLNE